MSSQSNPGFQKKGLAIFTEVSPDIGLVTSDRRRFEQVLLNLLSNAVKFTVHGSIRVVARRTSATELSQMLEVSVIDTGVGISPEHFPKLFQPFSQLPVEPGVRPEGTGLGLAICKRLVEKLGGTISVESAPGSGTKFTFTIPAEPPGE
ncbi:MAG: ATP-binding protein [Verrucomicrobiota bacterium]|nr:ATP-binding protein [Verrucomicrobiota bacterium]